MAPTCLAVIRLFVHVVRADSIIIAKCLDTIVEILLQDVPVINYLIVSVIVTNRSG